jgi:hypothetical protein
MPSLDLSDLLSPHTVAEFLTEYFGQNPLHVTGTPGRFASLLPRVSAGDVIERIDETCEPVTVLAQNLERALEARIRASLYAGLIAHPVHRDEQDVMILQIAGENQWRIHGKDGTAPSEQPAWEAPVKAGDALYLPRGWWHANTPRGPDTLQITVRIDNPTGIDLLAWATEILKEQECLRMDIPRFAGPAVQSAWLTAVRRAVAGAFRTPGLLQSYAWHLRETAPPRPWPGVPWSPTLSVEHVIAMAAPRDLQLRRADKDTIFFVVNGRQFAFPGDAAPLLHYLRDNAPVAISEFYKNLEGEFDREELSDFLSILARDGIIALREPDTIY